MGLLRDPMQGQASDAAVCSVFTSGLPSAYYVFISEQTEKKKTEKGRLSAHVRLHTETRASTFLQQFSGITRDSTFRREERVAVLPLQ